jgi:MFS transporter, CP family, cyanate transporter
VIAAVNLRPGMFAFGPLIDDISDSTGLSRAQLGLVATLPPLCFAVFSPAVPGVLRRLGYAGTLRAALAGLAVSLVVRSWLGVPGLFLGTIGLAACIGALNVALPPIIKRDHPARLGEVTAVYTTAMLIAAGVGAVTAVPIAHAFGGDWRPALSIWALPALAGALVWARRSHAARGSGVDDEVLRQRPAALPVRQPVAWLVTVFFGLQAFGGYVSLTWLPNILAARGVGHSTGDAMLGITQLAALPAALLLPALAVRAPAQRIHCAAVTAITAVGTIGLFAGPTGALGLWAALQGFGQGGSFALSMTLIVLRSRSATESAGLSALVQSAGYVIAAAGPVSAALLHSATGAWTAVLALALVVLALQLAVALPVGSPRRRMPQDGLTIVPSAPPSTGQATPET